ncbi:MAG: hypothetical protein PHS44_03575 [Candidatus Dojkabacteria bacterium]|nr:hypothetical protein [Candidatus Dojkabacteria bacterium]
MNKKRIISKTILGLLTCSILCIGFSFTNKPDVSAYSTNVPPRFNTAIPNSVEDPYRLVYMWAPVNLFVDDEDNVYFIDNTRYIYKYTKDGQLIQRAIIDTGYSGYYWSSLAVDHNGYVYLSISAYKKIYKLTSDLEISGTKANQIIQELKELIAIIGKKGESYLNPLNDNDISYSQNLALNGKL